MGESLSLQTGGRPIVDQKEALVAFRASQGEVMSERKCSASLVAPEGLGFGDGSIGVHDRLHDEADLLSPKILHRVDMIIDSDEILVDLDVDEKGIVLDDDGCGDGRGVKSVFEGFVEKLRSLNRAKIFGGAPTMTASAIIGLGGAEGKLNRVYVSALSLLDSKNISYGGHTDNHANGTNCGCGAIDKAPATIGAVVEKKHEIATAINGLGIDTEGLDEVFANFTFYNDENVAGYDSEHNGSEVINCIKSNDKVVKELLGPHAEVRIILNTIKGKTVNQELIRQATDEVAQVFAVDVWRLQDLAERIFENPKEQRQAFLSMLAHTLGVAAVLTKGDLPVYTIAAA